VDSLRAELGASYEIRYPIMPEEGDPTCAVWKVALQKEFATLADGAIVIGHSVVGTILIHAWPKGCRQSTWGQSASLLRRSLGRKGGRAMTSNRGRTLAIACRVTTSRRASARDHVSTVHTPNYDSFE
jgi:hypothetical protein